ncbi:hypothetical protein BH09MYX1_BH09MYX1_22960 [soil metagenome]
MTLARLAPVLVASVLGLVTGCSNTVEGLKVVSPSEALDWRGSKLAPVAIIRGDGRAELPAGAHVTANAMKIPRPGVFEYHLDPGETVQSDTAGRIVAIQSGTRLTRFIPGTATRSGDDVSGELVDHEETVELLKDDRIELAGTLTVGDELPYGGRVERQTANGAIAAGVASFIMSYAPSAFVAATSSLPQDRWLFAPVIGPWIDLGTRPTCVPNEAIAAVSPIDPCLPETLAKGAMVASGVLQGLGAILTVVGLPSGARAEYGDRRTATIRVEPAVGQSNGVALSGTF